MYGLPPIDERLVAYLRFDGLEGSGQLCLGTDKVYVRQQLIRGRHGGDVWPNVVGHLF